MTDRAGTAVADACPDREQLAAYNTGSLSRIGIARIALHLESCPRCLEALRALDRDADPLVRSLAGIAAANGLSSGNDARLVGKLTAFQSALAPPLGLPCPPRQIGPYEILEPLGVGGMGAVFKARHIHLGKIVALKLIAPGRIADDSSRARFLLEMKAVGKLSHPNIVQAYDAGVESVPYLAMEFLEGVDLAQFVKERGPLTVAQACECVRQAAQALQHAFSFGMVHRDIKPSNLLLTPNGAVKLLDLGLARLDTDLPRVETEACDDDAITLDGDVVGTIDYIAPEQLRDSRAVDIRADLYSLGCTLYFLLTGSPPFGRGHRRIAAKKEAHLSEPPPDVRSHRPETPEELGSILQRLLAKNPDYRFTTPAELCAALEPFVHGVTLQGLTEHSMRRETHQGITAGRYAAIRSASEGRPLVAPVPGHPRWSTWASVLSVFLLAAILGLGVLAMRDPGENKDNQDGERPGTSVQARIESMAIEHFRSLNDGALALGSIGSRDAVRVGDSIRVTARLSEPAHLYLVAYRPDGMDVLCYPVEETDMSLSRSLAYPRQALLRLHDPGLHAFVLVATSEPLPSYDRWRTGPLAGTQGAAATGVWKFDGRSFTTLTSDLPAPVPLAFKELCKLLAERPHVSAVQAIAFSVRPEEAPKETEPPTTKK